MAIEFKKSQHDKLLIKISLIIPLIASVLSAAYIFAPGYNLETIYIFLRWTGWYMLGTFLMSFSASTLYFFCRISIFRFLLEYRRYSGIAFSAFLFIHFFGLFLKMMYDIPFFIEDTTIPEYILGVIAIFFTATMALTSTDNAVKKMGTKQWSRLHTWGGNCLLFGFWITYFDHEMIQFPIFLLINIIIILRSLRKLIRLTKASGVPSKKKMLSVIIVVMIGSIGPFMFIQEKEEVSDFMGIHLNALDYFPLFEGNQWTYVVVDSKDEKYNVTLKVRDKETIGNVVVWNVYYGEDSYKTLGLDKTGIRKFKEMNDGEVEVYNPPGVILPHLVFGESSGFNAAYTIKDEYTQQLVEMKGVFRFKVSAIEDVYIDSGRYIDCIRVEYYDKWVEPDGSYDISKGMVWFAKNIGKVKEEIQTERYDSDSKGKVRFQENHELISLELRKWNAE